VTLRTANVSCSPAEGKINVSILFYKSQGDIFTVFFHEASDADVALANQARDGLAQVVRKLGAEQPPAQPPAGGPQGQPAPPKTN
jgi:hypothetical protein